MSVRLRRCWSSPPVKFTYLTTFTGGLAARNNIHLLFIKRLIKKNIKVCHWLYELDFSTRRRKMKQICEKQHISLPLQQEHSIFTHQFYRYFIYFMFNRIYSSDIVKTLLWRWRHLVICIWASSLVSPPFFLSMSVQELALCLPPEAELCQQAYISEKHHHQNPVYEWRGSKLRSACECQRFYLVGR